MAGRRPKALERLATYARDHADEPHEIRAYVAQESSDLVPHLGAAFAASVGAIDDDRIVKWIDARVREASAEQREARSRVRDANAQASADLVASGANDDGYGRIYLDARALLSSCLTTPSGALILRIGDQSLVLHMRALIAIRSAALDSDRWFDLHMWIDTRNCSSRPVLRIRAGDSARGFNLRGESPPDYQLDALAREPGSVTLNVSTAMRERAQAAE